MPLTEGDLVTISSLTQYAYTDTGLSVVPDIVVPAESLNSTGPLERVPYQHQHIDFIGGGEFTWVNYFQNPSQRVIIELEIYFGKRAPVMVSPDLSNLRLTMLGFDNISILCPPDDATDTPPDNFLGLTKSSIMRAPVYKLGGRRSFVDASGLITIPLTILAVSTTPLRTSETSRQLSVSLQRINTQQTTYYPAITGKITVTPLATARDTAAAT